MMYHAMRFLADALALLGLYPDDVNEVAIIWLQHPGDQRWRVKVGTYTVTWNIKQEV